MERVSIVIPNHNLGRFVSEAIDSALSQTHPDVELIVVDDGSTDDSLARIRAHPSREAGAFRLVEQANGGVSRARNNGARLGRGQFLVFLDADDVLLPEYVERCLAALRASPPSVAYAYTQMRLFGAEDSLHPSAPFRRRAILRGNVVNASAMIRKPVFDEVGGFDPSFTQGHEDHELWVRMLAHGYSGVLVPEPLLRYRRHPVPSRNTLSREQLRRLHFDVVVRHPRLYWTDLLLHPFATAAASRRRRLGSQAGRVTPGGQPG